MTNQNDIIAAINNEHAHDVAEVLEERGLDVTRRGNWGADEECVIEGFGTLWWDDQPGVEPGWIITGYSDGCDYPIDNDELLSELVTLIGYAEAV